MIWRQDGDPDPEREDHRGDESHRAVAYYGAWLWPTCDEIRHATAHELADTVTAILSGSAVTYGLGGGECRGRT